MRDTARFYFANLHSGEAGAHLEYIEKRRLSPTTIKKFGLGASLNYNGLPRYLLDKGYTKEECLESGVCSEGRTGLYDALAERLIVPIINQMDEVVAFGGRIIERSDRAKYKNTCDTILFNKSKNLFNLNRVKKLKRASGISSLIMVEGYMDAISLAQAGFENVVASMGTSLTKEQARLCKRYTDNVFISYDGDFAGQKANLRGLDIMKQEGLKVRVVPLPDGLDPDDVIRTKGYDGYANCIENAMPLIDFRIRSVGLKYNLERTEDKRDYVKEALAIVGEAESATEREELLKRISADSGISYGALVRDFENVPKATETKVVSPILKEDNVSGDRKAERFILAACLFSKPYTLQCDLSSLVFSDETLRQIADYIVRGRAEGHVRPSGLFDEIDADGELSDVLNLDYGDNLDGERAERYFNDSVKALKLRNLNEKIADCRTKYMTARSEEERRALLSQLDELTKQLKHFR